MNTTDKSVNSKQQLTELIEAYATARATGNNMLIQSAGASLIQFLETCSIEVCEQAEE